VTVVTKSEHPSFGALLPVRSGDDEYDYELEVLPGVKIACQDFLLDKPEREQVIKNYFSPGLGGGALVVKQ